MRSAGATPWVRRVARETAIAGAAMACRLDPLRRVGDFSVQHLSTWPYLRRMANSAGHAWRTANIQAGTAAHRRVVGTRHGVRLAVSLEDYAGCHILVHGELDPEVSRLLKRIVPPGAVALDIGANVGYYACLLGRLVGRSGHVHAFEANPPTCDLLRHSVQCNGFLDRVSVVCAAVADAPGTMEFFPSADARNSGVSSLLRHPHLMGSTPIRVPTITVDDYLSQINAPPIHFIKMDVECAEPLVLQGMSGLLSKSPPPFIVSEVTESAAQIVSGRELIAQFSGWGYDPYDIRSTGLVPTDTGRTSFQVENVCFVHRRAGASLAGLLGTS